MTGDINSGGKPDIVISAPDYDGVAGQNVGKVFVFYGESLVTPGTYSMTNADLLFEGEIQYGKFGSTLK